MQPKLEVLCGVDNCKYWAENHCHASSIDVQTMGDGYAETSDGTCCSTFIPVE